MALRRRRGAGRSDKSRKSRKGEARTGTPADLLVVGLANPGDKYVGTRHNVGAEVVAVLEQRWQGRMRRTREMALVDEVRVADKRLVLAIPDTYMNLSGEAVRPLVRRHGIDDLSKLVVIHDELDLPAGRIQIKLGGGLAGHNGLKSIKAHLGSQDFARVRVGIDRPAHGHIADWVLKRPGKADREAIDDAVIRAVDAAETILTHGIETAMERFNGSPGDKSGDRG